MLRLRLIEGLPLAEVGQRTGVTLERVRQLLKTYFGLREIPPTVKARRHQRRSREAK
jgi:DNA-directed RNA polymerase sigma subunit (sigma70/sigma32)